VDINKLTNKHTYYYGLFAFDRNGNSSRIVNISGTPDDLEMNETVSNLSATPEHEQVVLNWTTPSVSDFDRIVVKTSTTGAITAVTDGVGIYDEEGLNSESEGTVTHTGLTPETTYYYGVFAYDNSGNISTVATTTATPVDLLMTDIASAVSTVAGHEKNTLSWTNPSVSDFDRIMIRVSTSGAITTPTMGTSIYDATSLTSSEVGSYTHSDLTNETLYYYGIFAFDNSGNVSTVITASATPQLTADAIFSKLDTRTLTEEAFYTYMVSGGQTNAIDLTTGDTFITRVVKNRDNAMATVLNNANIDAVSDEGVTYNFGVNVTNNIGLNPLDYLVLDVALAGGVFIPTSRIAYELENLGDYDTFSDGILLAETISYLGIFENNINETFNHGTLASTYVGLLSTYSLDAKIAEGSLSERRDLYRAINSYKLSFYEHF